MREVKDCNQRGDGEETIEFLVVFAMLVGRARSAPQFNSYGSIFNAEGNPATNQKHIKSGVAGDESVEFYKQMAADEGGNYFSGLFLFLKRMREGERSWQKGRPIEGDDLVWYKRFGDTMTECS